MMLHSISGFNAFTVTRNHAFYEPLLYLAESIIFASLHLSIFFKRTRYVGLIFFKSRFEQNKYDTYFPGKQYPIKDEAKQNEIKAAQVIQNSSIIVERFSASCYTIAHAKTTDCRSCCDKMNFRKQGEFSKN